jgi:hypothetical protein
MDLMRATTNGHTPIKNTQEVVLSFEIERSASLSQTILSACSMKQYS